MRDLIIFVSVVLILKVETSCVISPDRNMLTIRDGLARDVELHCQCMDDNGIITGTRWFLPNMGIVPTDSLNRPYSTGTAPSRLIFTSPFTNSDTGTYTCSPNDTFPTIPPGDNITLNAAAELLLDNPEPHLLDTTCTIASTNLPGLTTAGGPVPNGTENLIIYCICTRMSESDIVAVGPTIWSRDNGQVTLAETDETNADTYYRNNVPSPLIIPSFTATHVDRYRCRSGSAGASNVDDNITLTAQVFTPVITKHPADIAIELITNFTNLTLTCEADGASSYNWERQNSVIPSDSTGVNTNTLTLINLQPEDAGNYRCVATNASGSNVSNYAMITITICAPHIVTHPTNTSAAAPFGAVFNCSIQVYGYLTITWYRSNEKPVPSRAYSRLTQSMNGTTSTLTIPNVTSEDVGTYYCEAWANRRAVQSLKANLFLAELPIPPVVMTDREINLTVNDYILVMKCLPDKINFDYKWIKKNHVLPSRAQGASSSQLIIVNLKPEDSGDYQCVMSNRTGSISSSFVTVHVRVSPPIISKQPNHVNASVLSSVSFNCVANAYNGELNIAWKRLKYNMPVTTEVTEEKSLNEIASILKFTNTIGYYSGQYYCVAENEAGTAISQTANLNIQAPKPEIIMSPENVTVLPNHSFTMSCLASSFGLLQYDWSKRGGILPQTVIKSFIHDILFNPLTEKPTNLYNLAVHNVQLSDEGWYCCVATNDAGSTEDCAWLEVNTLPNITVQPVSKALKKEDINVTALSCSAIGMGPIYYEWQKYYSFNNSWISPSHRAVNTTSPDLVFSVISNEDEGVYRCVVTNDDGSVISDNAIVRVYGPPIIKFVSNYTVSIEGDKVNLICSAVNDVDANHPLQIKWYKGSKLIMEDNKRIILHSETGECLNSTLLLDPVKRTDDGMYTCRSFNRNDSFSESKINLTVQYPVFVSILNKSPYTTYMGSLAILYCEATGKPFPLVQWFKDDIPVTVPSQMQQLFRIPTNMSHITIYTCKGINYIGDIRHTRYANVTVNVKVVKPCLPLLDAPKNGKRTTINEYGIVKYISFTCNRSFVLKGKSLATCDNGTWSSSTPTCDKP